MTIAKSILDTIGDTPLIRLNRASLLTGCERLGTAEFLNPGQSVKDRAALSMVRDAEAKGLLRPGGRIVEGTAGNTGIGLAMVAKALGYRCTIVIPRTQSQEKKDAIRLYGAELVEVDAVPYANEMNYVKVSGRLARELDDRGSLLVRSGPISSTTSPTAKPMRAAPGRRSGPRPVAGSTASSALSARAEHWPAWLRPCARKTPTLRSASPTRTELRSIATTQTVS